jgi:hypothetical protein
MIRKRLGIALIVVLAGTADLLADEALSSGDVSTSATAYYGAMQSPPTKILEQQIINLTGFSKSYYQTE